MQSVSYMMIISGVKWENNTWCDGDVRWRKGERSVEGGLEAEEVWNCTNQSSGVVDH